MSKAPAPLIPFINRSMELDLPEEMSMEELRSRLSKVVNDLMNHDFEKLVYYLYRIDVDENRMRQLLQAKQGENAANLIADLMIERQLQKIETRKNFDSGQTSDEEKW